MNVYRKSPFFLNGKEINWVIGKKKEIWGLPLMRQTWAGAKARLQEIGFIAGSEVLAISGPKAHFRAVIGSDRGVYLDEMSAPWGLGPGNEIYPVRVELTNIQDINCDWFNGPRSPLAGTIRGPVFLQEKPLHIATRQHWRPQCEPSNDLRRRGVNKKHRITLYSTEAV